MTGRATSPPLPTVVEMVSVSKERIMIIVLTIVRRVHSNWKQIFAGNVISMTVYV